MRPVLQSTAANHKGKKKKTELSQITQIGVTMWGFSFFEYYELYPSLRHTGMMLFLFFLICLVSNKKFWTRVKPEGRLGFSCPAQTTMLVPRKMLIRVHLAQLEPNMSRVWSYWNIFGSYKKLYVRYKRVNYKLLIIYTSIYFWPVHLRDVHQNKC